MHRKVEYTYWFLNDILIEEPMGVLTNLLLVILAWYFAGRLFKQGSSWPIMFFLFIGLAHLAGSMAHGFFYIFGESMHLAGWLISGTALFFLEWAIISGSAKWSWLRWISLLKLISFAILAFQVRDFLIVNINFGIGMIGMLLPIEIAEFRRTRSASSLWFLRALVFLLLPAVVSITRFSPHNYFTPRRT